MAQSISIDDRLRRLKIAREHRPEPTKDMTSHGGNAIVGVAVSAALWLLLAVFLLVLFWR